MKALGNHLIIEMYNCNSDILNNKEILENQLIESIKKSGAQIINSIFHKFSPHGVTGVVAIAESHVSIHTWPEYQYCAMDIFTCGNKVDSDLILRETLMNVMAITHSVFNIKRGTLGFFDEDIPHKPEMET